MNKKIVYNVDYFIDKFEKIPENKWCAHDYSNGEGTKFCAAGHCGATYWNYHPEANTLADIFISHETKVAHVNDGGDLRYQQPTPKGRILAALRDIKKIQESSQVVSKEPDVHECDATEVESSNGAWPNKTKSFTNLIPVVSEVQDLITTKESVK